MPKHTVGERRKKQGKVHKVMSEFKRGTLHSGSGGKVTSRRQAIAIAMSEAGLSRKKRGKKRHNPSSPFPNRKGEFEASGKLGIGAGIAYIS